MKTQIAFILFFSSLSFGVRAQQELQHTQFMLNKLGYNPAYVAASNGPELALLHRSQWLGLEGAPNGQAIAYAHPLLNERVGLGGGFSRTNVGITTNLTFNAAYCYRFEIYQGHLGLGVQASLRNVRQNWADARLQATQPISSDAAIPTDPQSKLAPNFGFGAYYNDRRFYVGLSVPRLVQNNIDFAETGATLSREARQFYLMGGMSFELGESVVCVPQALLKYVANTPFDADINCNFQFNRRLLLGLTYRTGGGKTSTAGESLDLLAGVYASQKLFLGLSYDIGLTQLRQFNNGSVEAAVRFLFNPDDEGAHSENPRHF